MLARLVAVVTTEAERDSRFCTGFADRSLLSTGNQCAPMTVVWPGQQRCRWWPTCPEISTDQQLAGSMLLATRPRGPSPGRGSLTRHCIKDPAVVATRAKQADC